MNLPRWMIPSDLAPGDLRSAEKDWSTLEFFRIDRPDHPRFESAYQYLWDQFGAIHEIELREVLRNRLARPHIPGEGIYEMGLFLSGGEFAGVCDHSAIPARLPDRPAVVVHVSHHLVAPAWRRTGLAGWLRAIPVETARRCLTINHAPADSPIILAGEVEPPDPRNEATLVRLKASDKAGHLVIDPARVNYHQPDFRSPEEIDRSGGPAPLPFLLVIRRVGREAERMISGAEVRAIVESLYRAYEKDFRASDMAPLWKQLDLYPPEDAAIPLLRPAEIFPA